MKKSIVLIILTALILSGYLYKDLLSGLVKKKLIIPASIEIPEFIERETTLPGPLQMQGLGAALSYLTASGTVALTNEERTKAGLATLTVNKKLNLAAENKIEDMFSKQYFEHISPEGKGPSDLAETARYEYIIIGENLALGNFSDDAALIQGWMNSPGHRANILNTRYREIGVAVKQGLYQGKETWLAVQEFGSPLSTCPKVENALMQQISLNEAEIRTLEKEATEKMDKLENNTYPDRATYNQKVEEYNTVVIHINALVESTKLLVQKYNSQVRTFNACVNT